MAALLKFFLAVDVPENLVEVIEAAEGPGGLACLVVEYYRWLSSVPQTADEIYVYYDGMTGFLLDAGLGGLIEGWYDPPKESFGDALIASGYSTAPRLASDWIGTRDFTFMRFLVANDTSEVNHKGLCSCLSVMRKHPGDSVLHTVDYTHGHPKQYIGPLGKERARDKHGDVCWDEHVARAARSDGRMELYLMRVWDGNRTCRWMFPRRSHCSTLQHGLIRILNDIHPDDASDEVEKLLEDNGDVVQIRQQSNLCSQSLSYPRPPPTFLLDEFAFEVHCGSAHREGLVGEEVTRSNVGTKCYRLPRPGFASTSVATAQLEDGYGR
ncbi:hypothetical protein B0H13DRAFT_1867452 [Mycena leptocephala]|nr:hypothetical protein B0H13DRAFT_1867452 [Mycena leptocephala]